MKKFHLYLILSAAVLTFACHSEPWEPDPLPTDGQARNTLGVTLLRENRTDTKTLLLDSPGYRMETRWESGDRIGVFGSSDGTNIPYDIAEEAISYGGRTALFRTRGTVPDGDLTAYYPYDARVTAGPDGSLRTTLPEVQPFTRSRNVAAPYGQAFILAGKGNKGDGVELRNVLSLLKIGYVASENQVVTQVLVRDLSGSPMNGTLDIVWKGDIPVGTVSEGSDRIVIDCPDGVLVTGEDLAVFWAIVPPRDYPKGIAVTFVLKDGKTVEKTFGTTYGKSFERNVVYPIGDVYAPVRYNGEDIQWAYKDPDAVLIVDGAKTDLIRDASTYDAGWPRPDGSYIYLPTLRITVHQDFGGKKGDYVFFNQPSELLPNGFVGQIMEYESYGNEADLIIKSVEDIAEPFKKLSLGKPIYGEDGSLLEGGGLELDLASHLERIETPDGQELPFDVEGDTLTLYEPPTKAFTTSSYTSPRLKLKTVSPKLASGEDGPGEMSVGVQLKLSTKFSMGSDDDGHTEFLHFNVNPKVLLTFNVKFSASKEFESLNGYQEFGTFYFAPVTVGPIVLRPQVEIGAYCSASASAELNVSYKYVANWGNYGFSYIRSQGFAVRSFVSPPDDEDGMNVPEAAVSGNIGFSVGLNAKPSLSLYGLIAAHLETKIGLNFAVGYEAKIDNDGFSRGLYFQITPEFSLTPSVTTLGGLWNSKWAEWQPLDFDPLWQKYILPEMKVNHFAINRETGDKYVMLNFYVDSEEKNYGFQFKRLYRHTGVTYDFSLRKETLFGLGVGFAIFTGDGFSYPSYYDDAQLWCRFGLEDYLNFRGATLLHPRYERAVLIEVYNNPDDGEDVKQIKGSIDYDFENGVYYEIRPCLFIPSAPTASLLHYDMTDYTEFAVCHWPYLSNGNEYPLWLESWFDEENQCWVKTIPDN